MSKKQNIVVVDDGSNYIKVSFLNKAGKPETVSFESRVINKAMPSLNGDGYSSSSYLVNGNKYTVSKSSTDVMQTDNKEYQYSEHNRALIHHALRHIGISGSVEVCATLPIGTFFNYDGSENETAIDKKCENMKGEIEYLDGSESIKVTGCYVIPESIPAFVNAQEELGLTGDRFLVVDVGGTTTDIAVITSDSSIEKQMSFNVGAFKAIKEFTTIVCSKLDLAEMSDDKALQGFLTGSILGEDVSDVSDRIKRDFSSKIDALVRQMGEVRLFDAVILTGGGSNIVELNYSNAVHTQNPQFDNANGMLMMVSE